MHVCYMAKHQLGQCQRRSNLGQGHDPGNRLRDDIDRFEKGPQ